MANTKRMRITVEGKSYDVSVELLDDGVSYGQPEAKKVERARVASPVSSAPISQAAAPTPAPRQTPTIEGGIASPMAGVVTKVLIKNGDRIEKGQDIILLEAMKMECRVTATQPGVVDKINIAQGDAVQEGQVLVSVN